MERTISSFYRWMGPILLLAAAASLPTLVRASLDVVSTNYNNVADWLPAGFEETTDLYWFVGHFGSDEILVVSWPGLTLDDDCLPRLADRLLQPTIGSTGQSQVLFRHVFQPQEALESLTSPPVSLAREEALERLAGWLIGPDGKTGCVVALVSPAGMDDRHAAVELAYQAVESECGVSRDRVHLGGPTVDSVAIDNASVADLWQMMALATLLTILVSWRVLRSWLLTLVVYASAVYCQLVSLALMHYTGQPMNSVLIMVPTLIYVLSASAAIHIINYYLDAARETGWATATGKAVLDSWLPCTLAAVTTAAGLGSLYVSELVPIRTFGIYSASAVLDAIVLLFLIVPSALTWISPWIRPVVERQAARLAELKPQSRRKWKFRPLARFVIRYHRLIVVAGLALLVGFGAAIKDIGTSVRLEKMFRPDSKVVRDYRWLEENLGPLIPLEVVLRFPAASQLTMLDRLLLTEQVQRQIEHDLDDVGATISVATFAPPTPSGTGARQAMQRRVLARRLADQREALFETGYLHQAEGEELWRITARAYAMRELDYDRFRTELRGVVGRVVEEFTADRGEDVGIVYCGGVPLVDSAQRQLLEDLFESFLAAFGMIAVLMLLILRRSFRTRSLAPRALLADNARWLLSGGVAMIPNVFPVVLVFGSMAWLDVKVDIGTMMTASVALGIAVDDTVHFFNWFQHAMASGHSRKGAVMYAYHSCATAMVQTSLICGLGMFTFVLSEFVPISRFSWLLAASLAAALVGDLLFLPAILVSPIGRIFRRQERR